MEHSELIALQVPSSPPSMSPLSMHIENDIIDREEVRMKLV